MKKFLLFFIFFLYCGPPEPEEMPKSIEIYTHYSTEELEKLLISSDWKDRSNAILYIEQNKLRNYSDKLLDLLKKDPSSGVRQISALTLSEFEYKPAIPVILNLLKNPRLSSGEIIDIRYLIDSIGNFQDFEGLKYIIPYLNEEDLTIRLHVVKALENIEIKRKITEKQKNEIGNLILKFAKKSNDTEKNRTFAMALGRISFKPSEDYLLSLLKDKEAPNTKAAAILSLGKIKSKKSIPILVEYLKTYPDKLGENSYLALMEIRSLEIVDRVFPIFDEKNKELQYLVVDILANINHPTITEKAYKKFLEKNPDNIGALSLLLGKLKFTNATKEIEILLLDTKVPDREIIAKSLGWMQDKRAIPTLIKVLTEEKGDGRYGAAWSLGVLEAKEALPYLIKTSQSKDKKLAILSIEALGHLKSPDSLSVLEKLARDSDLQLYALESIGEIPDKKSLEILFYYAKQPGEVSHLAIEILSRREEKEVITGLITLLEETSTEDIKSKMIYKALQRKTKKDFITKNQWIEWYRKEYKK